VSIQYWGWECVEVYLRSALGFYGVVTNKTQEQIYPHYIHLKIFVRKDTQVRFYLYFITFRHPMLFYADPSGRTVYGVGLRSLTVWDRGSASCCGQDVCQVEVYEPGWSLVQRSPTEHGVCNWEIEASTIKRLWLSTGCHAMKLRHQITYNEIWGAFVQPVLPWKMSKYYISLVCVCIPMYPACNAHSPYCHLRSVRLYNIFPPYFVKDTIFEKKKLLSVKVCFDFLYNFDQNFSHPEKNWAIYG
jgi:hypothetical protein